MSSMPEVFALDCTEAAIHVVRLAVGEPLSLIEQRTLDGIREFQNYWSRLLKESPWLCVVAEDHPNDPAGILPLVENRYQVDRQFVKFREVAYQLPFRELGIEFKYQRAGALALNKALPNSSIRTSSRPDGPTPRASTTAKSNRKGGGPSFSCLKHQHI